jgi:hypothetical protein
MSRFKFSRDANEPALVALARQLRLTMIRIDQGPFDYLAGLHGRWHPVEIKNPETHARAAGGSKLQASQISCQAEAVRANLSYWVWECEDDVLKCVGARRSA